jgi:hypothetical protein
MNGFSGSVTHLTRCVLSLWATRVVVVMVGVAGRCVG